MEGALILIAGGDQRSAERLAQILKFHNPMYQIHLSSDSADCLARMDEADYDLVLVDSSLADVTGLDFLYLVNGRDIHAPILMLIEESHEQVANESLRMGALDYVTKTEGFLASLPHTVRHALAGYRMGVTPLDESLDEPPGLAADEVRFITDSRGSILSATGALSEITSFSEEELTELSISDILPPETAQQLAEVMYGRPSGETHTFATALLGRGEMTEVGRLHATAIIDEGEGASGYRIRWVPWPSAPAEYPAETLDRARSLLLHELADLVSKSSSEPLESMLNLLCEAGCRHFRFRRSAVSLLDRPRLVFVRRAVAGIGPAQFNGHEQSEISEEVVSQIFDHNYRVKVLYYDRKDPSHRSSVDPARPERRSQLRRQDRRWDAKDVILLNLKDREDHGFGFISLDSPMEENEPPHDTFENLSIFSRFAAVAIENSLAAAALTRRSRRLQQILMSSNIFRLDLSLTEALNEVVWSVMFAVDFRLVVLFLFSSQNSRFVARAVACQDKAAKRQLQALTFTRDELLELFRPQHLVSRSYLVNEETDALARVKRFYRGAQEEAAMGGGGWTANHALLVPIRQAEGKLMGVILADDPTDRQQPGRDTVKLMEVIASQVSVTIDNRLLYLRARRNGGHPAADPGVSETSYNRQSNLKDLITRIVKG